jgi:hypothetical protein
VGPDNHPGMGSGWFSSVDPWHSCPEASVVLMSRLRLEHQLLPLITQMCNRSGDVKVNC